MSRSPSLARSEILPPEVLPVRRARLTVIDADQLLGDVGYGICVFHRKNDEPTITLNVMETTNTAPSSRCGTGRKGEAHWGNKGTAYIFPRTLSPPRFANLTSCAQLADRPVAAPPAPKPKPTLIFALNVLYLFLQWLVA
jgi:hypothetical protein